MYLDSDTAGHLVEAAATAITQKPDSFRAAIDEMPAPIYVTDEEGTITYFNRSCEQLAGRTPTVGEDKWCVTWKLFTPEGADLPHDQCPMAVTIREQRPVRGAEAIAERPDGSRISFIPFPTPLFDDEGNLTGAVNLLLDITLQRKPEHLTEQAARCRRLARATPDQAMADMLGLMATKYDEQALKLSRRS